VLVAGRLRHARELLKLAGRNAVIVVGAQLAGARLIAVCVDSALLVAWFSGRACGARIVTIRAPRGTTAARVVAYLARSATNPRFASFRASAVTTTGKYTSALRVILAATTAGRRACSVCAMIARSFANAICVLGANSMATSTLALFINALHACAAREHAVLVRGAGCHAACFATVCNAQPTGSNAIFFAEAIAVAESVRLAMPSGTNRASARLVAIAIRATRQTACSTLLAEPGARVTKGTRSSSIAAIVVSTWSIACITRFRYQQLRHCSS